MFTGWQAANTTAAAGAVLACESIGIAEGHDANAVDLLDLTGLGLITGVEILPHFTGDQRAEAALRAQALVTTVIGMPESIGIHCAGQIATVVGTGTLSVFSHDRVDELAPGETFRCSSRAKGAGAEVADLHRPRGRG